MCPSLADYPTVGKVTTKATVVHPRAFPASVRDQPVPVRKGPRKGTIE